MIFLCECDNFNCLESINLSIKEAKGKGLLAAGGNKIMIMDNCLTGPEKTDTFVSKENGYTIYQEG